MSSQNPEPQSAEDRAPELELNKETLQDLDVEPADAGHVKGGGAALVSGMTSLVQDPYTQRDSYVAGSIQNSIQKPGR